MTLGQRIQTLRLAAGWSQEQMAEQLSVTRQTVSKWERNLSTPDVTCLLQLSDLFRVSLDELLRGESWDRKSPLLELEQLAAKNRRERRRTVMAAAGCAAVVSGGLMLAFCKTLEHYLLSLHYMLYRYMTVGEYIPTQVSFDLPACLGAAVLGVGFVCLLRRGFHR